MLTVRCRVSGIAVCFDRERSSVVLNGLYPGQYGFRRLLETVVSHRPVVADDVDGTDGGLRNGLHRYDTTVVISGSLVRDYPDLIDAVLSLWTIGG